MDSVTATMELFKTVVLNSLQGGGAGKSESVATTTIPAALTPVGIEGGGGGAKKKKKKKDKKKKKETSEKKAQVSMAQRMMTWTITTTTTMTTTPLLMHPLRSLSGWIRYR